MLTLGNIKKFPLTMRISPSSVIDYRCEHFSWA
jgi:hypothetical protein